MSGGYEYMTHNVQHRGLRVRVSAPAEHRHQSLGVFVQLGFKIVKHVASRFASLPLLFSESSGVQIHVLQHIGSSCVSHFWVSVSCVLRSAACAMAGRLFSSPDTRRRHREEPLTTEKHPH
jgi:hypothetical protein